MKNILLVEDDAHINNINMQALSREGYNVQCATSISSCMEVLSGFDIDLIVLDVNLPDGDGLYACQKIKQKYNIPILFLSAMGEHSDIAEALNVGGDDYMTKPYSLEVLVARVRARLRSSKPQTTMTFGGFHLDSISNIGTFNGKDILLTRNEFYFLWILADSMGKPVSRSELHHKIWGDDTGGDYNAMRVLVSRIKYKLADVGATVTIVSKRQVGYMLVEQ